MAPVRGYARLTTSRRAPNEKTDGVLWDVIPDLFEGISGLLQSLRSNLVGSDGPKPIVPEVFYLTCEKHTNAGARCWAVSTEHTTLIKSVSDCLARDIHTSRERRKKKKKSCFGGRGRLLLA